ncbi:MAG: ATP-binding protein [Dehalococcoidia bacterium]
MAALMRAFDWSTTSIGPVETWSPTLRMMVQFLLVNRFPLLLWWGPQYVSIYNDSYRPVLGAKHPWALGRPVSECWSEIWHILQPLIDTPFHGGPATWNEDILLELNRYGFLEEAHFTIAYSPVHDDSVASGIGGVLATVHEITEQVVGQRRVVALRDLGAHVGDARTAEDACAIVAQILAAHSRDVPFVLLYLFDADGARARLAGAAGVEPDKDISPLVIDLRDAAAHGWPMAQAVASGAMQVVESLADRFTAVPPGPWSDPPNTAAVIPIPTNRTDAFAGCMVVGVSARLQFDAYYRDFLDLVRTQVATAIANARAYEEEHKRAEALAELDRAKTAFFSNVSHEFRTPLTLMLGPLEDVLCGDLGLLTPEAAAGLAVAHRNSLRLLRLVNTLLDFSRIEAGRADASFEPTDLAALTADLASVFRSAVERAGVRLVVDCPPLPEPVYVDRDMWEKVVLNLLSNAFKHTFIGEIGVALRWAERAVELTVRDTGVGIPAEELAHLFERFHRVRGARARSHEGTGIGLALVEELVRLHGGAIAVASRVDEGTTFTITIPAGTAHLPADRIQAPHTLASTALGATPYVEEALRWLPDDRPARSGASVGVPMQPEIPTAPHRGLDDRTTGARVLVADDNADMRAYLERLLGVHWTVEAVADGVTALTAVRERMPDLVLADVMMPGLDGLALLRALREDPRTSRIPVMLLSARAGEEARVDGVAAGADDYVVKPFSGRELIARVGAHLMLARVRAAGERALRESEELRRLATVSGRMGTWRWDVRGRLCSGDAEFSALWGLPPSDGQLPVSLFTSRMTPAGAAAIEAVMARDIAPGEEFDGQLEVAVGPAAGRWVSWRGRAERETPWIINGVGFDVTEQRLAEERLRESEQRQAFLLQLSDGLRPLGDAADIQATVTRTAMQYFGADRCYYCEIEGENAIIRQDASRDDLPSVVGVYPLDSFPIFKAVIDAGRPFVVQDANTTELMDEELKRLCLQLQIISFIDVPVVKNGQPVGILCITQCTPRDWTKFEMELVEEAAERTWAAVERVHAQTALRESEARSRAFIEATSDVVYRMSADWREMYRLVGKEFIATTERPRSDWPEAYIPEDEQPRVRSAIEQAIRLASVFELEHRVIRRDGTIGWTFSRAVPVVNERGEVVEWFGTATDITERKRAEAERERLLASERRRAPRLRRQTVTRTCSSPRSPTNCARPSPRFSASSKCCAANPWTATDCAWRWTRLTAAPASRRGW